MTESKPSGFRGHWETTLPVSCIVVAAIFEACEQALSSSPRTASHLADFHGLGNYVPLCLLIVAGASWLWGRRNQNPSANRQLVANSSNALTRAIPHNPGTFDSAEFFRTAYYSALQDIGANSFKAEAERARPNDKESFYLDVLAVGSIAVIYDGIWWPLYRSQLRALLALNENHGIAPLNDFRIPYDEAASEFAEQYKKLEITFEAWMQYLTQNTLITVHPSNMVEITLRGKDFLKYLLHWGRAEQTKRL